MSSVQVGRFFHWQYLYLMIFWFSSPVSFIGWEVFHWLIPCPVFLPSLSIIEFGGFSSATWPFETHRLPYRARIFSVVSRFSSPVSLIGLGGFSLGPHFPSTIPRSTELASKEKSNCNNVILRAKSSQSGSHVTTIIQNFTLVSLTSTTTSHLVCLLFGVLGPLLDLCTRLLPLRTQLLLTLRTRASMYKAERIFRLGICRLSTCQGMRLDHPRASLNEWRGETGWLDAARPPPLCRRRPCYPRWQRSDTSMPG